jgi:hypothetical protein
MGIKSNPTFRAEFARMCNTIGVDPLAASNVKGKNGRCSSANVWSNDWKTDNWVCREAVWVERRLAP